MGRKLSECARIRSGNILLIECQGEHKCGGYLRVPFAPGLEGAVDASPNSNGCVWRRTGTGLEDMSLSPSVDAGICGHFFVRNGEIV